MVLTDSLSGPYDVIAGLQQYIAYWLNRAFEYQFEVRTSIFLE